MNLGIDIGNYNVKTSEGVIFKSAVSENIEYGNKFDKIEFNVENKKQELSKEQELALLKQDLQKAIKEERYEDAGLINKKIKKLTKELQGE